MLCQKCKSKEANTHVKSVVNGEYTEYKLCADCAKQMGYSNLWSDMQSDFDSILGSFFSNALPARSQTTRCPGCGSTYHDIANSSKVGCAKCYEVFLSELMPSIRRIHSNTTHCGKKPSDNSSTQAATQQDKKDVNNEIQNLKSELEKAIEEQNFELAATLRDKIKEMEESK